MYGELHVSASEKYFPSFSSGRAAFHTRLVDIKTYK